jgi:hypothetical protein
MKPHTIPALGGMCLTLLLCSCASTSVKNTWKAPNYQGGPIKKAAVLVVDERPGLRTGFENRLANELRRGGVTASTTVETLSLPDIKRDAKAVGQQLQSQGAEVIVMMRLVDVANSYRETRPGHSRYAEVITGFDYGPWYDYYSVAYADMSPTYGNLKQRVFLETSVFELKTGQRLWAGFTETVLTENMDRLAELEPLMAKVVNSMRKDGIAP